MAKKSTPDALTDEHKQALAEGRSASRAVRNYLDALETHKPKRGRKRTADSISNRLSRVETELEDADPLRRLHLLQERLDLTAELGTLSNGIDLERIEADFVKVAAQYGARKNITYTAWRAIGVPADVLKRAGISRSSD